MDERPDEGWCCEDFRSANEVTFANPIDGATPWLLYGTDYESVAAGLPELRYWPIHFCPFCGRKLAPAPRLPHLRRRQFGKETGPASDR